MNRSFRRKVIYIAAMAALLIPMSWLSRPAGSEGGGGVLSRQRAEHRLSQANLGAIDPAGEAMKLSLFGFRGVAKNVLEIKAINYKRTEQWDEYRATLGQIIKLDPHAVKAYTSLAWELSYNISVEFDNFRHRYHWIKKGLKFLVEGTTVNRDQPLMLGEVGWFFAHKIGRADEEKLYRRMFHKDTEFHNWLRDYIELDDPQEPARGVDGYDNWLLARLWYLEAQNVVDTKNVPVRGTSPVVFHSRPAMAAINYAEAVEKDGHFGSTAQDAWVKAANCWKIYGDHPILSSYGIVIRLNDREKLLEEAEELNEQFDKLLPGVRDQLLGERRDQLTEAERVALDTPEDDRTGDQWAMARDAEDKIEVLPIDMARRAPRHLREKAKRLADSITLATRRADIIVRYRDTANFVYWRTRCEAERQDFAVDAREHLFKAQRLAREAAPEPARAEYELAWDGWAKVFEQHPILLEAVTAEDLLEYIRGKYSYEFVLDQLGVEFPPPGFKLETLLELHDEEYAARLRQRRAETGASDRP